MFFMTIRNVNFRSILTILCHIWYVLLVNFIGSTHFLEFGSNSLPYIRIIYPIFTLYPNHLYLNTKKDSKRLSLL